MRDPERIPQMLDLLRQVWEQNPDWRLGQLIVNAVREPFYVEDGDMALHLMSLLLLVEPAP